MDSCRVCLTAIRSLSACPADDLERRLGLEAVAKAYYRLITEARGDFSALRRVESSLCIPRARGAFIRRWFGEEKGFPKANMLVSAVEQGVPIAVKAGSNATTALKYGNHKSVVPFAEKVRQRVYDDVRLGRAVVFPRSAARMISGLRLSPLGAVVSPAKVRIIHGLSFNSGVRRPTLIPPPQ